MTSDGSIDVCNIKRSMVTERLLTPMTIFYEANKLNTKIYDVPIKFARKLINGGPVHNCHEPVEVLQWPWFYLKTKNKKQKIKNQQTRTKLKGRALHWPNYKF